MEPAKNETIQESNSQDQTTLKKCPRCAESIQIEAVFCKHCKSFIGNVDGTLNKNASHSEPAQPTSERQASFLDLLWLGPLVVVVYFGCKWITAFRPEFHPESQATSMILEKLKDPDSAYFRDTVMVDKKSVTNGEKFFVATTAFAKNSFNATIQTRYCVIFLKVKYKDEVRFNRDFYIQECDSTPSSAQQLTLKRLNGW